MAYELIETIEVGAGGAASIEFTSIPQDGVDLLVVASIRLTSDVSGNDVLLRFNSDTGSNYTRRLLLGDSGSVSSSSSTSTGVLLAYAGGGTAITANTFTSDQAYISNYTSSAAKSISIDHVMENNAASPYNLFIEAASWSGTSAISSIAILRAGDTLTQYTTASLYKIS